MNVGGCSESTDKVAWFRCCSLELSGSLTLADSSSLPIWLIFERKKKEKRENFLLVEVL